MTLASYHLTIIGTGQLGCSIGAALQDSEMLNCIRGYDLSPTHRTQAAILGAVNETVETLEDAVQNTDIILICSPLSTMESIFQTIGQHAKPGTIVTDVGSVKSPLIELAKKHMPEQIFIPGHPIAGTEKSGPLAVNGELFRHKKMIFTPCETDKNLAALATIQKLWKDIGAKPETMSASNHDRIYAHCSHIAHLLAWVHACVLSTAQGVPTNSEFYPFMRIAGSDLIMWLDIFAMNRQCVEEAIDRYAKSLEKLVAGDLDIRDIGEWRRGVRTPLHPEWGNLPDSPDDYFDRLPTLSTLAYCHSLMELEKTLKMPLGSAIGSGFLGITRPATLPTDQAEALLNHDSCGAIAEQLLTELETFHEAIINTDPHDLVTLLNAARETHLENLSRWGLEPR